MPTRTSMFKVLPAMRPAMLRFPRNEGLHVTTAGYYAA